MSPEMLFRAMVNQTIIMKPTEETVVVEPAEAVQPAQTAVAAAGALTDDIRAELQSFAIDVANQLQPQLQQLATNAAQAASDRLIPTIHDALSTPEFAQGMGQGVVIELRKPESAPIITAAGSAAGREIAALNPVLLTVGGVALLAVGAAAGYMLGSSR